MPWFSVKSTRTLQETENRLGYPTRKSTRKNILKTTWKASRKYFENQTARTVLGIAFRSSALLEETIFELWIYYYNQSQL